jgi:hypothetical protein
MPDPRQKKVERLGAKARKSVAKDHAKSGDPYTDISRGSAKKISRFVKAVEKKKK